MGVGLAVVLGALSCGPAPEPVAPAPPVAPTATAPLVVPAPAPAAPAKDEKLAAEAKAKVAAMLAQVVDARKLPAKHEVPSRVLDRAHILERIRAHVEKELPLDVVADEGEVLAALELVPPDYDFVEGTFKLIGGRIAGFYEPSDQTMYLVDDLSDDEAKETLAHELVHALQDQSFPLEPIIRYRPGKGDSIAAAHAVIEGDAMSAMFDVVAGSAFNISEGLLRKMLALSNATAATSDTTPRFLQRSLVAPYADGFAFVQNRRKKGGWAAVDAAFKSMPVTSEQLLHPDKYDAREPEIPVAVPSIAPLGPGFRAVLDDVVGEQGLRTMFEEWTGDAPAIAAAAGWGGDHYVVARKDEPGAKTMAYGWLMVFDTPKDASEAAALFKGRYGAKCRERATVGPLAYEVKGKAIALAAGPFKRPLPAERGGPKASPTSAGSCADATRWVKEMLAAAPKR